MGFWRNLFTGNLPEDLEPFEDEEDEDWDDDL